MFTLDQIKAAHSKVKSGADFPNYIQELIKLGLISYEYFVTDGHTNYYGNDKFELNSPTRYDAITIADTSNQEQFKHDLNVHQQGQTTFPTFCNDCAKSGVEKWIVDTKKMTCTYYDKSNSIVLEEKIPG